MNKKIEFHETELQLVKVKCCVCRKKLREGDKVFQAVVNIREALGSWGKSIFMCYPECEGTLK
jgi:hypothetical protein